MHQGLLRATLYRADDDNHYRLGNIFLSSGDVSAARRRFSFAYASGRCHA